MLSDEFLEALKMDAYVQETYAKSVAETPRLAGESALETRRREISYLNQKWFMADTLRQNGRNECALWFVSESAVCGLSDCGVLVERTMGDEGKGRRCKGTASGGRKRIASG